GNGRDGAEVVLDERLDVGPGVGHAEPEPAAPLEAGPERRRREEVEEASHDREMEHEGVDAAERALAHARAHELPEERRHADEEPDRLLVDAPAAGDELAEDH